MRKQHDLCRRCILLACVLGCMYTFLEPRKSFQITHIYIIIIHIENIHTHIYLHIMHIFMHALNLFINSYCL